MTDKALKNAKALEKQLLEMRESLREQLNDIDSRISKVQAFIHNWHAYASGEVASGDSESPLTAVSQNVVGGKQEQKRATGNSPKEDVAAVARELISKRGEPIPRRKLLKLLLDEGLTISGTEQDKVLSTMLWRMKDKVVNLPRVGYWLPEKPWEPAGYRPPHEPIHDPRNPYSEPSPDGLFDD